MLWPRRSHTYTCSLVIVCVPYRSIGSVVTTERTYLADAAEAQREQGRPLLQCWQPERPHARYLHEEERRTSGTL